MKKLFISAALIVALIILSLHLSAQSCVDLNSFSRLDSLQHCSLDPASYHTMRDSLQNSLFRFEDQKTGQVAFLGGSITYNPGWRDSVCSYLLERFPETDFNFIEAGIPSMGSTPSAFRLEQDVLTHGKVDLLFVEAAVNDATNGRTSTEQIRAMEGIIRHLRNSNPYMDIVMMHFVDPDKMSDYRAGEIPGVIRNHNMVAAQYMVPTINLAKEVTDRIDNGEFTWEDDFINLHPSPFGQGVYARSINKFLENAYTKQPADKHQVSAHIVPEKLEASCYDKGSLLDISSAKLSDDWHIDTDWNPDDGTGVRPGFVDVPMLICTNPGSALKLKFEGKAVGIVVTAGQDAGIVEYRIDKKEWLNLNLFTEWSSELHLPWYYTLAAELNQKSHLLEIRVSGNSEERSTGNACRIRYFFVNRH